MIAEVRNAISILKVLERNVEDLLSQATQAKDEYTARLDAKDKIIAELEKKIEELSNKEESDKGSS